MPHEAQRTATFVVPGRLDTITGGYIYDRRIIEGLRQAGWHVHVSELPDEFPAPSPGALMESTRVFAGIPDDSLVVVDGLAFGALPDLVEREARRLRLVALVHLPLAADVTLDPATAGRRALDEQRALSCAAAVVVTGRTTLALLERYSLKGAIAVVEPGTDRAAVARGSSESPVQILSVATVGPGKGHEILIDALAALGHRRWHLTCAGSLTRYPATVERVRTALRHFGLDANVSLVGELDEGQLSRCYETVDLFALATLQETYGMAVAEALAHGVPVISTVTGAIPALVGDSAGLVVMPGDRSALAAALRRVLGPDDSGDEGSRALRAQLKEGAVRVRAHLPSWDDAVRNMSAVLSSVPDRMNAHG